MQVSSSRVGVPHVRPLHRLDAHVQVAAPLQPLGIGMQANVRSCRQNPFSTWRPAGQTPASLGKKIAPP
jgi:hypothetical protein